MSATRMHGMRGAVYAQVGQKALWEQTYTMFLRFDKDNKGTLNRAEVELGIQRFGAQLSAEQLDEMLSAIGANAGELNMAQFMTLLSMMTGLKDRKHTTMEGPRGTEYMKVAEKAMWEQVHNLFVKFDTDNSGYVDVKEVMQGIGRFGANLTEEQVKEIFRRIGVDDRGLSKSQFMTLLSMIMTLKEKPKLKAGYRADVYAKYAQYSEAAIRTEFSSRAPNISPIQELLQHRARDLKPIEANEYKTIPEGLLA